MRFDVAVIGGGIVGTAAAREISRRGRTVLLLEKEDRLASHQSGHNSGVIHSGVYYAPGSLKARLCVAGGALLKAFCLERRLPLKVAGKVIVATSERDLPRLDELYRRGTANGVAGVVSIGPERLKEIEPNARGVRALHLPEVAVTDFAAVTRAMAREIAGEVRTRTRVLAVRGDGVVETTAGDFRADRIVNCAGLHSDRVARRSGARPPLRIVPFRGEYFRVARRDLVRGLVYPVPDPDLPFLGVHFTRTVSDEVEAGPNAVLGFAREGYRRFDFNLRDFLDTLAYGGFRRMARRMWKVGAHEIFRSLSREAFAHDLRRLVPALQARDLRPGGSGVRAQAVDPEGRLLDDFRIVRTGRAIHILNAPSPAATASLAIARVIADEALIGPSAASTLKPGVLSEEAGKPRI